MSEITDESIKSLIKMLDEAAVPEHDRYVLYSTPFGEFLLPNNLDLLPEEERQRILEAFDA